MFSLPGKQTEKEFKSKSPDLPYLLLDVRDPSEFATGHIITAENYPKTQLSRANFETPSLLKYVSSITFKFMQLKLFFHLILTEESCKSHHRSVRFGRDVSSSSCHYAD